MNELYGLVTEVLSEPYNRKGYNYDLWCVDVKYDCYGTEGKTTVMSKEKAGVESIAVGTTIRV